MKNYDIITDLPFYTINRISMKIQEKHQFTISPYQQIVYITNGHGEFICEHGTEAFVKKGDVLFVHSGYIYAVHSLQNLSLDIILFNDSNAPLVSEYFHFGHTHIFHQVSDKICSMFYSEHDISNRLQDSVFLYTLITELGITLMEEEKEKSSPSLRLLQPAIDYIRYEFGNPDLSAADLCQICSLSVQELDQHFKKAFHTDTAGYIQNSRIEHMKEMIFRIHLGTLNDMANTCGYRTVKEMSTAFQNATGLTLLEFRNKYTDDKWYNPKA